MQMILITFLNLLYYAVFIFILARVILSFMNLSPYHPISRLIHDLTEPILEPVRRFLPPVSGFDFSPIVVLLLARVLHQVLVSIVISL
jgi:YggT family protein